MIWSCIGTDKRSHIMLFKGHLVPWIMKLVSSIITTCGKQLSGGQAQCPLMGARRALIVEVESSEGLECRKRVSKHVARETSPRHPCRWLGRRTFQTLFAAR